VVRAGADFMKVLVANDLYGRLQYVLQKTWIEPGRLACILGKYRDQEPKAFFVGAKNRKTQYRSSGWQSTAQRV
jgi:hypothetical protein